MTALDKLHNIFELNLQNVTNSTSSIKLIDKNKSLLRVNKPIQQNVKTNQLLRNHPMTSAIDLFNHLNRAISQ